MPSENETVQPFDKDALLTGCQALIQAPGTAGQEQEAAAALQEMMRAAGFDRVWSDGVGNVIGEIRGALPGKKLLFDAQLDTMPVSGSDFWSFDPYEGEINDGRLYGRGAVGMKGALAAMVHGLAPLAKCKDKLAGALYVSGSIGGEVFPGLALAQILHVVKPDAVVIGAPTGLNLACGQRGRAELTLVAHGKAAHSACATAGENAVQAMLGLIAEVNRQALPVDASFGKAELVLTNMISAPYPAAGAVPHKCWATFDRYLLPGETETEALQELERAIAGQKDRTASFAAEVIEDGLECYTGQYLGAKRFSPAWKGEAETAFFKAAQTSLEKVGLHAAPFVYPMATNAVQAVKAGLPTIGFGPGRPEELHRVDEAIEVAQLEAAAAGYQAIAADFLHSEES